MLFSAIEEGNFNIIPNIYMRLFIRSYAKYIDADYQQALVDYELHTTGKIQPKLLSSLDMDTKILNENNWKTACTWAVKKTHNGKSCALIIPREFVD